MVMQALGTPKDKAGAIPPYVPFRTFQAFLDKVSRRVPNHIDHGVMPRTSKAIRSQLAAALRYLGLAVADGSRTDSLSSLAKAQGEQRKKILAEIVMAAYPYLFAAFPLQSCSTTELANEFRRRGASGDTVRKCAAFFTAACREAGIEVSPHIKPFWGGEGGGQRSAGASEPAWSHPGNKHPGGRRPGQHPTDGPPPDWHVSLLLKFPSFDPAWSDEIKSKWFDDFKKLVELASEERRGT
jgi:hypothetical protein